MKLSLKKLFLIGLALFIFIPVAVSAHQPRVVKGDEVIVNDPEVSKAYYSKLAGVQQVYKISSSAPFNLYVNILVPDIKDQKKDLSVMIIKDGEKIQPLASFDGEQSDWKRFWEPFGQSWYLQGPEYRAQVEAGDYEVWVWSVNNDSKYSLAIGEVEAFDFKEGYNAIRVIPQLKKNFFNESPLTFLPSPFGWGLILVLYILAFILGLLIRFIWRLATKSHSRKKFGNIGRQARLLRACLGVIFLVWAITTSWHPIIIFLSGFLFFEAALGWCLLSALLKRNTRREEKFFK